MAEITVNYKSKSYTVNNSVNKKGFKFDNIGAGSQRTFNLDDLRIDISNMTAIIVFKEIDTDDVSGYEGDTIKKHVAELSAIGGFISGGNLNLKSLKIAALNALFIKNLAIEPLAADGSVKPAYK